MMKYPMSTYSKASEGALYSPFSLAIDPMDRLGFIDIKKDPDKVYVGFEFQVLNDETYGERIMVRAERKDGLYDLYHQPGLAFDIEGDIMSDRISDFIERPMDDTRYEVTNQGVDVYFSFQDKIGRQIKGTLKEDNEKRSSPFTILAPVGGAFSKPPIMPLYFCFDMYFPPKNKTKVTLFIDGLAHQADSFPIPLDWSMCYFSRYSTDTFIVNWNKNYNGKLSPIRLKGSSEIEDGNVTYNIVDNNDHIEIKSMSIENQKHRLKIKFTPALPEIVCLNDGVIVTGAFTIASDESAGIISGDYQIQRIGNDIFIKIHPKSGWEPKESKWSLKFLYKFNPLFRKWPKTYVWKARIKLTQDKEPMMESEWERTEGWKKILF